MTAAVELHGIGKRFRVYSNKNQTLKTTILRGGRASYDELWAIRDVSFEVPTGTTFGLIGSNGSGKSTLLRCLARILRADEGSQIVRGRVAALLELGSGFHQELTGRQNVYLNGTILGMKQRELDRRMDDIVSFAGLEDAIDQPVKNYSSGMYARLGFAVATSVDPQVLLVDEVLAVGDVAFQRRCMERIGEIRRDGRTVVIVSHDEVAVRSLCESAAWLHRGELREVGSVDQVMDHYQRVMAEAPGEDTGNPNRWGNRDVVISDVQLLDSSGEPTRTIPAGSPAALELTWACRREVRELVVGFAISAADGMHLWAANTAGQRVTIDASPGRGVVRMHIPHLPLQPGGYWIDAAAHDEGAVNMYDYWRRAQTFAVVEGGAREHGGYVSLGPTWEPTSL